MRISFDIDDTLICGPAVPAEQLIAWWRRWRYSELLRRDTSSLMQELLCRHCDIWLYTTSYRSPRYLRGWFRSLGIRLGGVVNQHLHEQVVGRQGPSKYPPAFGIDLHAPWPATAHPLTAELRDKGGGGRAPRSRNLSSEFLRRPDLEKLAMRVLI